MWSILERSPSSSVLPPLRYQGADFRPLHYPHAHAIRRVASLPDVRDTPYYLNRPYIRTPFRPEYKINRGEFGDFVRDKIYYGDSELPPQYSSWPVRNTVHLDTGRSIHSAYTCWSEARRAPTYSRDQAWYARKHRYDRPVLREYRPWVDPIPGRTEKYTRPSTDSFLYDYWLPGYKWEEKLNVDYRRPYEYRYNYYLQPSIYYHYGGY
jgi:hypothetical protein